MVPLDVIKVKFEQIQKGRPSAIRSTAWYGPIGWVLRIIGSLILIGGLFLIASGIFNLKLSNSVEIAMNREVTTGTDDTIFIGEFME